MRNALHAGWLALVACSGTRAPAPPPETTPAEEAKTPMSQDGHPIDDTLFAWLDSEAGKRTLQMPVEVHKGMLGGVERAVLRGDGTELDIELDTTTLSMTFDMHLDPHCKSSPCTVWIEGTWGASLSLGPRKPTLTVRKVLGPVEGDGGRVKVL